MRDLWDTLYYAKITYNDWPDVFLPNDWPDDFPSWRIWAHRLDPMVQEFFPEGNTIFQDDNAPIHKAKVVTK